MSNVSKYFHDRTVLLFIIINSFLLILGVVTILFKLDSRTTNNYIIEYRASYGIGEYDIGYTIDFLGFVFFMIINFVISVVLSMRTFVFRKNIAVVILVACSLTSLLTIIVSSALMVLR